MFPEQENRRIKSLKTNKSENLQNTTQMSKCGQICFCMNTNFSGHFFNIINKLNFDSSSSLMVFVVLYFVNIF